MVDLRHIEVRVRRGDVIGSEIVRTADVVGRPVRQRIEAHQIHCDRVEALSRNLVTGERIAYVDSVYKTCSLRIVDNDLATLRVECLRKISGTLQCSRNGQSVGTPGPQALAFIGAKEKRLVLDDGAAGGAAKYVVPKPGLDLSPFEIGAKNPGASIASLRRYSYALP